MEDMELFGNKPTLKLLTEESKDRIHQAALEILREMGMEVRHRESLDLLKDAGCAVSGDNVVRIPEKMVKRALEGAPRSVVVYNRKGDPAMDLGGDRSYFGTGSDLLYTLDPETGKRHRSTLQDVRRAAQVCDALPNIDFIMSFAHPSDVAPGESYLQSFRAMLENSTKPIVCTAECRRDLGAMHEMAVIVRGRPDDFRERPFFIHYAEPTSPRKHPVESLDKLLFCAEAGVPVVYSPAPMAGATAPITIAGHVSQGIAECLCGMVIHQLKSPGAPFILGMGPAVMDMATAQSSYNAPEYLLAYMAVQEMGRFYDLPTWGYAGTCDTHAVDGQAAFEGGLSAFLSSMLGSNLNHDVGYMDFGRTGSLLLVVMMDEIIDQVRRIRDGVPVTDETLALSVMREVGLGGHFLGHMHTLQNLQRTQWRPVLLNRAGYEKWVEKGRRSFQDKASDKLKRILETHSPEPLPAPAVEKVYEVVKRFLHPPESGPGSEP